MIVAHPGRILAEGEFPNACTLSGFPNRKAAMYAGWIPNSNNRPPVFGLAVQWSALYIENGKVILESNGSPICRSSIFFFRFLTAVPVSYTHLRAHETEVNLVCRLLLEKIFF